LPTVVSWAGWKWVNARHASSRWVRANPASADHHQLGVVGHEAAGRAEVDDLRRVGPRLLPEVAHVGHHVVADLGLDRAHPGEVEVVAGRPQRRDLRRRHRQPERVLRLGERDPQVAPQQRPPAVAPIGEHVRGRVALGERALVGCFRGHRAAP
jgi:hypothetical protein